MSLGGSQEKGSGTQKTEPWDEQKPYLIKGFEQTGQLYDNGGLAPSYYPGKTVASVSNPTKLATDAYRKIGASGTPGIDSALSSLNSTLSGGYLNANPSNDYYDDYASGNDTASRLTADTASGSYLNSNPFLDAMYGKAAEGYKKNYEDATLGTQSVFAKSGRFGSNSHYTAEGRNEENLANGLEGLATDIYGGNYANERGLMEGAQGRLADIGLQGASGLSGNYRDERGNMLSAAGLSPALEEARYTGADKLGEYGKYKDAYKQDVLNADIDRYDSTSNEPLLALQRYMELIQGNYGGTTTSRSKKSGFGFEIPLF